ncbi:MAG: hypothetical protein KDA28_00045, partial [Phycisphaerales bacterium]|nr:hypothetical protein [Phycisphaerales bacterium]
MRGSHVGRLGVATLIASAAGAQTTIDFTEFADGSSIAGQSTGIVTFDVAPFGAEGVVRSTGGPEDGAFGAHPYLIGDAASIVMLQFDVPVHAISYDFALNDTIHSSAGTQMTAIGFHGITLGTSYMPMQTIAFWPNEGDAGAGHNAVEGIGPMVGAWIEFPFLVFGDTYALDNITITTWAEYCPPDLNFDDTLDVFDVLAYVSAFERGDDLADWNGDGLFDIFDVLGYLASF